MYEVKSYHFRKAIRKGDLESENVLLESQLFKTRKSAKNYIEGKVKGNKNVRRYYHTGDTASWVYCFTGVTWRNENSGERCDEYYSYKLAKAKPR